MFIITATRDGATCTQAFASLEDARDHADWCEVCGWAVTMRVEAVG